MTGQTLLHSPTQQPPFSARVTARSYCTPVPPASPSAHHLPAIPPMPPPYADMSVAARLAANSPEASCGPTSRRTFRARPLIWKTDRQGTPYRRMHAAAASAADTVTLSEQRAGTQAEEAGPEPLLRLKNSTRKEFHLAAYLLLFKFQVLVNFLAPSTHHCIMKASSSTYSFRCTFRTTFRQVGGSVFFFALERTVTKRPHTFLQGKKQFNNAAALFPPSLVYYIF